MPMRTLIVDDEPLARSALERILRARADVAVVDSAVDAFDALRLLQNRSYDVLLVDVRTPELSGIELLSRLQAQKLPVPYTIFVSAHNQHAVTAFEKYAVDFVLKPFSDDRINSALDAAIRRTQNERMSRFMELLPHLENLLSKTARIAIKTKRSIVFVDPSDVAIVEAQGNYVLLKRLSGSYLLRDSITAIAQKLEPYGFIRIHRSVLVNRAFVEEIHPWNTGEYVLRLRGGKELTVSRTYKRNLGSLAHFWVGVNGFLAD
jgi:two-component system, LytTR family, response regulator